MMASRFANALGVHGYSPHLRPPELNEALSCWASDWP